MKSIDLRIPVFSGSCFLIVILSFVMALSSNIRRSRSQSKQSKTAKIAFWPQSLQAFIARRLVDIYAAMFFCLGFLMFVALFSYDHADPSWNSSGVDNGLIWGNISNFAGRPGAWIADIFLQTIGLSAFLMAFIFLIWGVRIFKRQAVSLFWLRSVAVVVTALSGAIAVAQVSSGDWLVHPYMGSTLGTMMLEMLANDGGFVSMGRFYVSALFGCVCIASFLFAAAVSKDELRVIFTTIRTVLALLVLMVYNGVSGFLAWVQHYNDPSYQSPHQKFPVRLTERLRAMISSSRAEEPIVSETMSVVTQEAVPVASESLAADIPVVSTQVVRTASVDLSSQKRFALTDSDDWEFPPLSMLESPADKAQSTYLDKTALQRNAELLQNVLADYGIQGEITAIYPGPVVTLYELEPAAGTKSSRVISLSDDIARSMSAVSVRCAVVPGRSVIGIELPNKNRQVVYMQDVLASKECAKTRAILPLILGKDIGGTPIIADLAKMPHLLVAGTTGSGKSVAVNTMILSILYNLSPEQCRFIMIDPKMLELSVYDDIPHLLSPVVTEPGKAVVSLKWAVHEMEERYRAMSKLGVRNIQGYNDRVSEAREKGEVIMNRVQTGFDPGTGEAVFEEVEMDLSNLPYIVIVVDEFADLMLVAGKDVESAIQRLAQMARAAGIHLIMATQRPSVDVITGVVKANFPTRISFQVTSKIDSRTILGEGGAEQLLGMGDMLYMAPGGRITRVHGPFVSDGDVEKVVDHLKSQGTPSYLNEVTEEGDYSGSEVMGAMFSSGQATGSGGEKVDELYDEAVAIVAREGKASTSFVQRYLQIGYNRAARIIEEMEKQGVISPATATGKREVLVGDHSRTG